AGLLAIGITVGGIIPAAVSGNCDIPGIARVTGRGVALPRISRHGITGIHLVAGAAGSPGIVAVITAVVV
ncbi:MAG: hypothetical protein KDH19_14995, partial [Geminicoccaceae bacterium]|nr:hypothetical protein [Geminicoccaceae bacterium]